MILLPEPSPDAAPGPGMEALDLPRLHPPESSRGKLFDQWFLYHASRSGADPETIERLYRELVLTFKREGFQAESLVAGAFANDGFRTLEEGDVEEALVRFRQALLFDPHLGAARAGIARALGRTEGGFWEAWKWGLSSLAPLAGDLRGSARWGSNLLLVAWLSLSAVAALFVTLLALRHLPRWRHDLREHFSARRPSGLASLLAWGVVFAPALLWLGPVWLAAYWIVGLFPYARRSERLLAAGCLVAILLVQPGAAFLRGFASFWWDPRAEEILAIADGGYSRESVAALDRIRAEDPRSEDLEALLAQVYSDGGYSDEAYARYSGILETRPESAWVHNNLGNLFLRGQQSGAAIQQYHQAIGMDPALVEPYFNLHLAHLEQFQIQEAENLLRQAQELAPERVSRWVDQGKKHPWLAGVPLPIEIRVPTDRLLAAAFQRHRTEAETESGGLRAWWNGSVAAGGLGLVALLVLGRRCKRPRAERCNECGTVFCRNCQRDRFQGMCSACHHLVTGKDSLSSAYRAGKMNQIARFQARSQRLRRLLNLLLPGAGHTAGGRTVLGPILLLLGTVACVVVALRGSWIPPVAVPVRLPALPVLPFAGVAWLSAWALANLASRHSRD
ncbi:MAG: tetratricopeptide repeat protein [Acidobacteria bacterium]|nr:tetratricopeptide repeat protein [Acidobacteriota bacterium]